MDRRDFLAVQHARGRRGGDGDRTNGPVLAQTKVETEPGVNLDRPNTAYEGSKLNRKLEIVNLLDLEPEAQKVLPTGGFGYISGGSGANWTRRENTEAFSRVQDRAAGAERRRQGRPHDRNPRLEAVDADLHSADGQPRPRPCRQGGGDRRRARPRSAR